MENDSNFKSQIKSTHILFVAVIDYNFITIFILRKWIIHWLKGEFILKLYVQDISEGESLTLTWTSLSYINRSL